jgi:predicted DsbA family dithiol-disulfide isomerase
VLKLLIQIQDFFETDECLDEVVAMMNEARNRGVTGVPFTIIENKWAISGGQGADVYLQVCPFS